ncbi:hypothetical protein KGF54_001326 [Candida jiufengensis]|uniref:uncharacterized protein n=1 Tax=Candida jiufengensis TaxID=497108 RepID=UPI0022245146|nr:uncharacterized protein KGF54_001326 [Candida jiufengensis]KAI5955824.1 hypothetical protein KGF54_001326 [Candida jiufengensis]
MSVITTNTITTPTSNTIPIKLPSITELTKSHNKNSNIPLINSITTTSPTSNPLNNGNNHLNNSSKSPRFPANGYNKNNTSLPSILQQKEILNNNYNNVHNNNNNLNNSISDSNDSNDVGFKIPPIKPNTPTSNYVFSNSNNNQNNNGFNKLPSPALPYHQNSSNNNNTNTVPPQLPLISKNSIGSQQIPSPSQLANQHRGSYSSSSSSSSTSPHIHFQKHTNINTLQQSPISYTPQQQPLLHRSSTSLPQYLPQQQLQQQQPIPQQQLVAPSYPDINYRPVNKCHRCGTTETPEWRRGPKGVRTLCNACGLYHAKLVKRKGALLAAEEVLNNRVTKGKNGRRISVKKHNNNNNAHLNHTINSYGLHPQNQQSYHQSPPLHQQPQQHQYIPSNPYNIIHAHSVSTIPAPPPPQHSQSQPIIIHNHNERKFSLPPPVINYRHNNNNNNINHNSNLHYIPSFPLVRH